MNYRPDLIDDRMDITLNFAVVELNEEDSQTEAKQLLPFYQWKEQGHRRV